MFITTTKSIVQPLVNENTQSSLSSWWRILRQLLGWHSLIYRLMWCITSGAVGDVCAVSSLSHEYRELEGVCATGKCKGVSWDMDLYIQLYYS